MLKVVPTKSLSGDVDDRILSAYMRGGKYIVVSGSKPDGIPTSEIVELNTPIGEGCVADADSIVKYLDGNTPYHPIPIKTFDGVEPSRPSVDRYNIIYNALYASGNSEGMTLCDLGCHYGYFSFSLECCGLLPVGYDISPKCIAVARALCRILDSRAEFRVGDIRDIVNSGEQYDYVLCTNVFHYITGNMSPEEVARLSAGLGGMTRYAAFVTTMDTQGLDYEAIRESGGFANAELIGTPENSYPIWMLEKGIRKKKVFTDSLTGKIASANLATTREAADFIAQSVSEVEPVTLSVRRLDNDQMLCFIKCCAGSLSVRFLRGSRTPYHIDNWNSLVKYTGSPIVYYIDEHWLVQDFIEGEICDWENEEAIDLALARLALISICPTETLSLDLLFPSPSRCASCFCQELLAFVSPGTKEFRNLLFLIDHVSEFLPPTEANVVLGHNDFNMRNIVFESFDIGGCRVIDWFPALLPRSFPLAMFLMGLFKNDRVRFWKKVDKFLADVGWKDYLESELRGYLMLAVLLHAHCAAMQKESSKDIAQVLCRLDDILLAWDR